jgi:hypothetical protein
MDSCGRHQICRPNDLVFCLPKFPSPTMIAVACEKTAQSFGKGPRDESHRFRLSRSLQVYKRTCSCWRLGRRSSQQHMGCACRSGARHSHLFCYHIPSKLRSSAWLGNNPSNADYVPTLTKRAIGSFHWDTGVHHFAIYFSVGDAADDLRERVRQFQTIGSYVRAISAKIQRTITTSQTT